MAGRAVFRNRAEGGRALAEALEAYRGAECVVYGLPRGGAIVARKVADGLHAPLDLLLTRKLTHPDNPEYAIGAISDDGEVVLNEVEARGVGREYLEREMARGMREAQDRRAKYLGNRPPAAVEGKTAIIVDDGIATGYTMKAAVLAVRKRNPARIVVAAPVGSPDVARQFEGLADDVVVPCRPEGFFAIGVYYADFAGVDDEEVVAAMEEPIES